MAVLTVSERDLIQSIITRLQRGGAGRFLDDLTIEQLDKIFRTKCGFTCGCPGTFREGMRDEPWATILTAVLCGEEGLLVPGDEEGAGADDVCPVVVNLGTAETYAVLAASTITNTVTATIVSGDFGLHPGTAVTNFPPGVVIGTQHITDAAALQAQTDAMAAYTAIQGITGVTTLAGNIGGQTLLPGNYRSTSSLEVSSGDLILDGDGDLCSTWRFAIASTWDMTAGRKIILINGARPENIFFAVGSSATLGANAIHQGTIIALASVTGVTGALINGRAIALTAAVNFDENIVTRP